MSRSMLVMFGAAVLLLGLVFLFANPFKDALEREDRSWTTLFDASRVDGVDRIQVATGTDTTVLVRSGEVWRVASEGDFPADSAAVGNLLRAVAGARSAGVASNNPENRAKFQVDVSGVEVKLTSGGDPVAEFTLGKMGADFTTSYVLPAGSNEVHVVRGMNKNLFLRPQGMRDRTLLHFDPAVLKEVTAVTPDGGWVLSRTDTLWTVRGLADTESVPARANVADQIARTLGSLAADGFLEGPADTVDTGLQAPTHTITVRLMNGVEENLRVGRMNDRNQYYISRDGQSAIYTLGEWRLNNLAKKLEEIAAS